MIASLKNLKQLLALEQRRTNLAKRKQSAAFLKTYSTRSVVSKNGNTGQFWDNRFAVDADTPDQVFWQEQDRNQTAYRWLTSIIKPGSKVLNVACGDGKFESLISAQVADQIEYEGMDFATKSVAQLKPRFPKLSFWSGDIITKRLAKQYDLICAFEILEHISDSQVLAVLKKFHQALTVGGYLMVAVPTNEPLLEMYPANPNQHVRAYTREIITAELELSGFTFVKVEQFSAFSSYYWLKKLLSKTFLRGYWQANDILVLVQK